MQNDVSGCGCCIFGLIVLFVIFMIIAVIFPKLIIVGLILCLFTIISVILWGILSQIKTTNSGRSDED